MGVRRPSNSIVLGSIPISSVASRSAARLERFALVDTTARQRYLPV
jgi:hypothetical protein